MNRVNHDLIGQMTADLTPVKPLKARDGLLAVGLAVLLTVLAVHVIAGFWSGIIAGRASTFFMVTNGLLLVLGLAATTSVIAMAKPGVGNRYEGAKWALAMAAVLPVAALISVSRAGNPLHALHDMYGLECTLAGLAASSLTAAALVVWLRRGAPVSLKTVGWQTGVASGALGSLAYGLSCPLDSVTHLGIYHVAPVVIAGVIGGLIVPKLVRW